MPIIKQLHNLHDTNPKIYWDLIKKLSGYNNTPNIDQVPVDSWVNHYKSLLSDLNSKSSFSIDNDKHDKKIEEDLEKLKVDNFFQSS